MPSLTSKFRVLFCGKGHFQSGFEFTKEAIHRYNKDILVFQCSDDELYSEIRNADVVVPFMTKISSDVINHAQSLKLVMQFGVGLEGVDISESTKQKIWVSRIPSENCGNGASCAEHAIYLSLGLLRHQNELMKSLQLGRIGVPTGRTILDSKVLIYGYGGIGKNLALRLSTFGAKIDVITRQVLDIEKPPFISSLDTAAYFPEKVKDADIIFICCTQNPETIKLVNKQFLQHVKHGAILINVARGGLLDYDDVLVALESGKLGGLGIDVFHTEPFPHPSSNKILSHPRVIATPHVAGVTEVSYRRMAESVCTNVLHIFNNRKPEWVVNDF